MGQRRKTFQVKFQILFIVDHTILLMFSIGSTDYPQIDILFYSQKVLNIVRKNFVSITHGS